MMVLQVNLSLFVQVTLKAAFWILAGVDDEFATAAPSVHVFAARSVARFAALHRGTFAFTSDLHAGV